MVHGQNYGAPYENRTHWLWTTDLTNHYTMRDAQIIGDVYLERRLKSGFLWDSNPFTKARVRKLWPLLCGRRSRLGYADDVKFTLLSFLSFANWLCRIYIYKHASKRVPECVASGWVLFYSRRYVATLKPLQILIPELHTEKRRVLRLKLAPRTGLLFGLFIFVHVWGRMVIYWFLKDDLENLASKVGFLFVWKWKHYLFIHVAYTQRAWGHLRRFEYKLYT